MKSVFKLTLVMALMLSTAAGVAKEPKLFFGKSKEARSLIFELDTPSRETTVSFIDNRGNTIYSEKTGDVKVYGKKFDLKNLESGYYYLAIEDAFKEIVYTVAVDNDSARIVEKEEKAKPVFRKKGNKLFLNLLNLDESSVEIKVLDSSNRVLFKEVVEGKLLVEKAINFENAKEDQYTIVVTDSNDVYYENILVD